jgi:ATPase subunit of ABC transporter with duplicated ATPase domains
MRGDPGIGKTTLLDALAERAESEVGTPFSDSVTTSHTCSQSTPAAGTGAAAVAGARASSRPTAALPADRCRASSVSGLNCAWCGARSGLGGG